MFAYANAVILPVRIHHNILKPRKPFVRKNYNFARRQFEFLYIVDNVIFEPDKWNFNAFNYHSTH